MGKSFYDLDYIIEINEKRVEQYTSAYQQVLSKLTNIILIYSAIAIFLIPIIQEVFTPGKSIVLYICFTLFTGLFITSLVFTIKLIFPIEVAYLTEPGKYYKDFRIQYELTEPDQGKVDNALKASYIGELEKAVEVNDKVFKRKSSFYYNALIFALTSTIPFLLCLGYHIFQKDDKVQKIEIVKSKINCNLDKKSGNGQSKHTDTTCRYH
ncbi:hypothetical protein HH214_09845 [Mucilaginibacter robiniae]|uniref:Uncharacterized protein n=1 Tax=Mucilaginibacter robiniae TaxID=2728022 RepID=A0A7L5DYE5_9SPHI|nr:hypothetical protein [Mucilaginibacter robiniae]QJD96152.1 hypothetical protein HH214_09845 [Mucilaginibacter robiniae]